MEIDRRDFLKLTSLTAFGLFIPKFGRGFWKRGASQLYVPYDWELTLMSGGREVVSKGYKRLRGLWSDFTIDQDNRYLVLNKEMKFPQAHESWGVVDSGMFVHRDGRFADGYVPFTCAQEVRPTDTACFPKGSFQAHIV